MTHIGGCLVLRHNVKSADLLEVLVDKMSPQQLWLVLVLILFTSSAASPENRANDGLGMVTSFMTQLGALLERDDLRLLLTDENQPANQKKKPEDEQVDMIWKNIDGDDDDEGVLLRTLTAHIPCRWSNILYPITYGKYDGKYWSFDILMMLQERT